MQEIVKRLKEQREIELAKSILESNGYTVAKESAQGEDISKVKRFIKDHQLSEWRPGSQSYHYTTGKYVMEIFVNSETGELEFTVDDIEGVNYEWITLDDEKNPTELITRLMKKYQRKSLKLNRGYYRAEYRGTGNRKYYCAANTIEEVLRVMKKDGYQFGYIRNHPETKAILDWAYDEKDTGRYTVLGCTIDKGEPQMTDYTSF